MRGVLTDIYPGGYDNGPHLLRFACNYDFTAVARGSRVVQVDGARWEMFSLPEYAVPFHYAGTITPGVVRQVLKTPPFGELREGTTASSWQTYLDFPPGPEPRGGVAAHRASWTFYYHVQSHTDSAQVSVMCLPMVSARTTFVVREYFGPRLPRAQVTFGPRRGVTDSTGQLRLDSLTYGTYPVSVRLAGYAPFDSAMTADGFFQGAELHKLR